MPSHSFAYPAGKSPVNITINEQLLKSESQVMPFVQTKKIVPLSRQEAATQCALGWNEVADKHGSFADEYRAF